MNTALDWLLTLHGRIKAWHTQLASALIIAIPSVADWYTQENGALLGLTPKHGAIVAVVLTAWRALIVAHYPLVPKDKA